MKKDRQKLEDTLQVVFQDIANNNKIIDSVVAKLVEKGVPRGRAVGAIIGTLPLPYIPQDGLCLLTKYLYEETHEYKIRPEDWFNEIELQQAENYEFFGRETTNRIVLHNVDQINDHQWLCTKETYQNISKYFQNGLLTYNPKTQRQPIKRRVHDRIIEVINIDPKKINEIKEEILKNTFNTNAIIWNIRKTGLEKFKYNAKDRTLVIEVSEGSLVDLIDGMHRVASFLKTVEEKPEIDRLTSIYVYNVDEEKARQVIRQESKATPISEEWLEVLDVANPNMEVAKNINSRQRMNEMFNRVGLDSSELKREGKLVTFDTLAKTIEYVYDLKNKPFIEAQNVERFLIELFNIIIGINHSAFNEQLSVTRDSSYMADNNTFIMYIVIGEEIKQRFPERWQEIVPKVLDAIDFSKPSEVWKKAGFENNINLSTVKKISEHSRKRILESPQLGAVKNG